jgi:TPR repeat protein
MVAQMFRRSIRKFIVLLCFLAISGCANKTSSESEYNLGVRAYRVKDYASARQHWAKAVVEEHEIAAYNNLGYLLYYGLGGPENTNQAVSLWIQAAQRGERESQWHLGKAFEDGKGREQNFIEAYAWYRCAVGGFEATPAIDDLDAQIAQDASQSLIRLLPKLSPDVFEAAEKLAKQYVTKYSKVTARQ